MDSLPVMIQTTLIFLMLIQVSLVTVCNASDEPCVFPFLSEGNLYNDCTDKHQDGRLWCATTYDYSPKRKWRLCDSTSGFHWSVSYSPHSICALEGSSVNVSCSYTYPTYLTVQNAYWTDSGSDAATDISELPQYKGRVEVKCEKKHCSLFMNPVNYTDEGKYYCRITTNIERERQTGEPGVNISVTDLKVLSPSGLVREGDSVTLTCKATCNLSSSPSFIWTKDGHPVDKKQIIYNQLQLHPVSYEDEGSYTCAVRGHEHLPSSRLRIKVMCQSPLMAATAVWLLLLLLCAVVVVCGVMGLACAGIWMRRVCRIGEQNTSRNTDYSSIDPQGPSWSRAAGPPSAEATAGAEDDVQYASVQFKKLQTQFQRTTDTYSFPLQSEDESSVTYASIQLRTAMPLSD